MDTNLVTFSDGEADMGLRYARSLLGLTVCKSALLQFANEAMKALRKDSPSKRPPKLTDVLNNLLSGIQNLEERSAYKKAIGKMFSERSAMHRQAKEHHEERTHA